MRKRNVFISLIIVIAMIFQVFAMPFTSMGVLAEGTDTEAGPDPKFHIYIAFGESNMSGQGPIGEQDLECDDNYLVMCTTDNYDYNGNKREFGKWYKATPPLASSIGTKLSVADYFGRAMLEEKQHNDPDVKIGIIVVAVPGASISLFDKDSCEGYIRTYNQQWFLDRVNEYGGNPYQRLIECAKLAQKDGVIKGIIMHQGESDGNDKQWPSKVNKVYFNIKKDLNLDDDTPLLAGEVLRNGISKGANNAIDILPIKSKNFHVVSSEGFTEVLNDGQNVHFTSEEYREFGKRYAEKMLEVEEYTITVSDDGNGTATSSYDCGVKGKEIYLKASPNEGYKFKEWQVISGGVNIIDDKFTVGIENVEIKAIFEKIRPETCTVSFDANGGIGTMNKVVIDKGSDYILPPCTFVAPSGKEFDKWDLGNVGTSIKITSDITLKPVWKDKAATPPTPAQESEDDKETYVEGVGTFSADGTVLTDEDGTNYQVAEKLTEDKLVKNAKIADKKSGGKYKITKVTKKNGKVTGGTVTYMKPYNKNCTLISATNKVKLAGVTFNVTAIAQNCAKDCKNLTKLVIGANVKSIGKNAFNGCKKLKTITIKTTKLAKKTVGANAFKGIHARAKAKVPKKKLKSYTTILKARGMKGKKQKITK